MKTVFVETENVRRFHAGFGTLERRGAEEACLMVIDGPPGLGKTTALHHWVAQTGSLYLRANAEWTPNWFLAELLSALNIRPEHGFEKRFRRGLEALLMRQQSHVIAKRPFAVVIDEADHISRKRQIMETIRDFSDNGRIPFVLVGMGTIRDNLARYPQISSRIAQYVRFEPASFDDVQTFIGQLADVAVAEDLAQFIHQVTGGFNREIKEAIATVERFAKRNGLGTEAAPVTLSDMSGEKLANNRKSGVPIVVPEMV